MTSLPTSNIDDDSKKLLITNLQKQVKMLELEIEQKKDILRLLNSKEKPEKSLKVQVEHQNENVPDQNDTVNIIQQKWLKITLQRLVDDIIAKIKKSDENIRHIREKIENFATVQLYHCSDTYRDSTTVSTSACEAYILGEDKLRSLELVKQLDDPKTNSEYYQILNNPKSTLEEKNSAVLKAYEKYGRSESKEYKEYKEQDKAYIESGKHWSKVEPEDWILTLEPKTFGEIWKYADEVFEYYFRNLKPEPKLELDLNALPKRETYQNDLNRLIYEFSYLPNILAKKQEYLQYLITKCSDFPKKEVWVDYELNSDSGIVEGCYYVCPSGCLPDHEWKDDFDEGSMNYVCSTDNDFLKKYFDFSALIKD